MSADGLRCGCTVVIAADRGDALSPASALNGKDNSQDQENPSDHHKYDPDISVGSIYVGPVNETVDRFLDVVMIGRHVPEAICRGGLQYSLRQQYDQRNGRHSQYGGEGEHF